MSEPVRLALWQVALGVAILAAWDVLGRIIGTTWISSPALVTARLSTCLSGDLYVNVFTTLGEVAAGLALGTVLGIAAGLVLGRAPLLAHILRPLIFGIYSVPLIALAPLFIMFFGLDMAPKIVLVALVVFFLMFFNTLAGAQAVDEDLIATLELMGANRREIFQNVIAPACMVWIIGGLKIALPYALVAATTGEILAARRGMGFLLSDAAQKYNMTSLYAALFVLALMGLMVAGDAVQLEKLMLKWLHAT